MHPLDGPRAKVKRAKSQIVPLRASFERLFRDYPYDVVVAEFDKKAGHYHLRIQGGPPSLPDEWGVLIGEIAHNLRSALDLLAWQLVLLSGSSPSKQTEFPIFLLGHTEKKRNGQRIPHFCRKGGLPCLKGIHRRFRTRIKELQPYKRRNLGRHSPLYLLHELNIADKHRLITVLSTVVGGMRFDGLVGGGTKFKVGLTIHANANIGYVYPLPSDGVPILNLNTMRVETQHEMKVNLNVTPGICFGDGCDAVKRRPVIHTLYRISDEISRIVESFAPEFD